MLEGALPMWSETRLTQSEAKNARAKRCFEVALPAQIVDPSVAKAAVADAQDVVMTTPLPLFAGHAVALAWCLATARALATTGEQMTLKLLEAALSVPIRLRLEPGSVALTLYSITCAESLFGWPAASGADSFWDFAEKATSLTATRELLDKNESITKLLAKATRMGLTHKNKKGHV